jgi:hypothetical protein
MSVASPKRFPHVKSWSALTTVCVCLGVACERKDVSNLARATESPRTSPKSTGEIAGSAYLVRGNGESILLRDFQVTLLHPAAEQLWHESVTHEPKNSVGAKKDYLAKTNFDSDLHMFDEWLTAKREIGEPPLAPRRISLVLGQSRTDVDGKFEFSDIEPGQYIIYAAFKSEPSTVCWFAPITVAAGGTVQFNLTNSTARVIVNDEP